MEKPPEIKKGLKLSALDRKTLLAHAGVTDEAAVKPSPGGTTKNGIHK